MSRPDDRNERPHGADDEESFDLTSRLLRAAGSLEAPPPDLEARARAVVEAHWRAQAAAQRRRYRWTLLAVPLAASLAIAAAATLWWTRNRESQGVTSLASQPTLATAALVQGDVEATLGEGSPAIQTLVSGTALVAGSRVTTGAEASAALALDANTSLRLAAQTSVVLRERGRVEVERGSIYVDRSRDRDPTAAARREPLEVITRFAVVTDIGTQFEVTVGDDSLTTRVREGEVAVTTPDERHLATAGTELEWSPARGAVSREIAPYAAVWAWAIDAAPPVDLDGWTLERTLTWLSRETGRVVTFADGEARARLGAERIEGELRLAPNEAIEIVPRLFGLSSRIDAGKIVLETANG